MKFYKVEWRSRSGWKSYLPDNIEYPCVVLVTDSWDDFGFQTYYELNFYRQLGEPELSHGVKILKRGENTTNIPNTFDNLDNTFCSLGQSSEYYQKFHALGIDVYHKVFTALNDVVYSKEIASAFQEENGFSRSLLRFSEAEKAFKEAGALFPHANVFVQESNFKFQFICTVPGADVGHIIDFDFSHDKTNLYRIIAIIGKNGTGKTQTLANFANAMSGRTQQGREMFKPERPSFSKVIAISYSVFDEFDKPSENSSTFSYKYCGIREGEQLLSPQAILDKLSKALNEVSLNERKQQWIKILSTLLGMPINSDDIWISNAKLNPRFYEKLSSGQRILVLVITEVIAYIANESIILFDEPEIHLHPDILSALARAFHLLLEEFNSYAIIATHSPIILQEIPSKYVRVFQRQGNYPIVSTLGIECFGENLTVITDDVFETTEARNNYREYLKELSKSYSYEEILSLFDDQLGFNARAFLSTLYSK